MCSYTLKRQIDMGEIELTFVGRRVEGSFDTWCEGAVFGACVPVYPWWHQVLVIFLEVSSFAWRDESGRDVLFR